MILHSLLISIQLHTPMTEYREWNHKPPKCRIFVMANTRDNIRLNSEIANEILTKKFFNWLLKMTVSLDSKKDMHILFKTNIPKKKNLFFFLKKGTPIEPITKRIKWITKISYITFTIMVMMMKITLKFKASLNIPFQCKKNYMAQCISFLKQIYNN